MAPIIGSWPVARNRLDFVRPDNVAGQISAVSVVVGKMHTRLRDGPDGTPVSETIPRIGTADHAVGPPVRLRRTGNQDRRWPQVVELHIDSLEHDVPLTPDALRKLARYLDRLAYAAAETPGRRGH